MATSLVQIKNIINNQIDRKYIFRGLKNQFTLDIIFMEMRKENNNRSYKIIVNFSLFCNSSFGKGNFGGDQCMFESN